MNPIILSNLVASAKEVYPEQPIMQQVVVTQAILESNYVGKPNTGSDLAWKYNNLFGIKGHGTLGTVLLPTHEYENGHMVAVEDYFAHNSSFMDSFKQHDRIMNLPRYIPVRKAESIQQAFHELQLCGYATDPKYPTLLMSIYTKYVKERFDA